MPSFKFYIKVIEQEHANSTTGYNIPKPYSVECMQFSSKALTNGQKKLEII